jgi:hypothetical protein
VKAWRIALFLVATLVLWYLGNFALNVVWLVFDLGPSGLHRGLQLVLLPVVVGVAWLLLARVPGREDGTP